MDSKGSGARRRSPKSLLAQNLRAMRERAGLTQLAVAAKLETTRQTVNSWEREDEKSSWPDEDTLQDLADLYGTTPRDIRYGVDAAGSLIRAAYVGGAAGMELAQQEREILSELQAHLVRVYQASDPEVRAAIRLVQVPEGAAFMAVVQRSEAAEEGERIAAMEFLAEAVRIAFKRRRESETTGRDESAPRPRRGIPPTTKARGEESA